MPSPGPIHILLAGATGDLGLRIARALRARGAGVRAVVRRGTAAERTSPLLAIGVTIVEVDLDDTAQVTAACKGVDCVVSALNGLRATIIGSQSVLLDAAIAEGVPRFIPSDFCLDFTRTPSGSNRNMDLRREFKERLDGAPIRATSIFNGAFMDMLTGQAPFILFGSRRVIHWGDADRPVDFTTMDDAAAYTAAAAMDADTPRVLRIAGEVTSPNGLAAAASEVTGKRFKDAPGGRDWSPERHDQGRPTGGAGKGPGVPTVAGHAVHARHVQRRRQARAARQRTLS